MLDIRVINISKRFVSPKSDHAKEILSAITLDINQGNFILFFGPSGSGKTTLLMHIGGILLPDQGSIYMNKENVAKLSAHSRDILRGKHISYIFQNNLLLPELTVLENILFPYQIKQAIDKKVLKKAYHYLEYFDLLRFASKKIGRLSGGEQQLVNFIRGIMPDCSLLIADEPTSELDNALGHKVFMMLKKMNQDRNTSIVLVSHSQEAKTYAKDIYSMDKGRITSYEKLR
jgi:ABC-type lipoprotein export system ATPase subunit